MSDTTQIVPIATYSAAESYGSQNPDDIPVPKPLSHYVWVISRQRWKILTFVLLSMVVAFVVSKRLTPIYEATATIDIDREMPQAVIGQDALRTAPSDADEFLSTQVDLIRADAVLRPVALKFGLWKRENQAGIAHEERAKRLVNAPVALQSLKVSRKPNTYLLLIKYQSPDPALAAAVANAIAESYIENTYTIRFRSLAGLSAFMQKEIAELKSKMETSAAALVQFERELNVINPEEKTSILGTRLLQLNQEYTNAQADRVKKEAAYTSAEKGSLAALQVSNQGEALKRVTEKLYDAEEKFADVKSRFGTNHPEYKKSAAQVAELQSQHDEIRQNILQRIGVEYQQAMERDRMLQAALKQTKSEYDHLNARSLDYQALKREAEADKKFYEELVRKIKEAGINSGFQGNSVRLADSARPPMSPVSPDVPLNVAMTCFFSLALAVTFVLLADALDNTLHDSEQVQRMFNMEVVGILPSVKSRRARIGEDDGNSTPGLMKPGATHDSAIMYLESVRALRNSILLSNLERRPKTILITSAGPSEGKTMTAVHLAMSHAEQKRKTLLIDCDFRLPSLEKYIDLNGMNESGGLSRVLSEGMPWMDAIVRLPEPSSLHVIPAGSVSCHPADLIGETFDQILAEASKVYDLVVIDGPPVLGFAESMQLATNVHGVVIISVAGQTKRKAIRSVIERLKRVRAPILGIILNKTTQDMSESGYHYYSGYYGEHGARPKASLKS